MTPSNVCLVIAATLFLIGSSSPLWGERLRQYWSSPIGLGLFYLTLSFILR